VVYASSSSALATGSALTFDGSKLGIGGTSPFAALTINGDLTQFRLERGSAIGFVYNTGTSATDPLRVQSNSGPVDIYTAAGQPITFTAGGSEGLRLTSSSLYTASGINVGIGTSSPAFKLDISAADTGNVVGGSTAAALISNSNSSAFGRTADLNFGVGAGLKIAGLSAVYTNFSSSVGGALAFCTNNGSSSYAERARISAAGGFSVGTTADPGIGAIYATGNITAFFSSDIKFKENVRDIPNALATVNAIGGKLFDWTDDYIESKGGADGYFVQKADFGVVAQDVQKVFPIAVRTRDDGSLAVDYEKLGALAFAALVELTKRVEALEAK
jgi:hypothetical protein